MLLKTVRPHEIPSHAVRFRKESRLVHSERPQLANNLVGVADLYHLNRGLFRASERSDQFVQRHLIRAVNRKHAALRDNSWIVSVRKGGCPTDC
jgi:hypothetical protein